MGKKRRTASGKDQDDSDLIAKKQKKESKKRSRTGSGEDKGDSDLITQTGDHALDVEAKDRKIYKALRKSNPMAVASDLDKQQGSQTEPVLSGKSLRSGAVFGDTPISKKPRLNLRNAKDYLYPSAIGPRVGNRKPMSDGITTKLVEFTKADPLASSVGLRVRPLTTEGKVKLKESNVSRNHILADSRIRVILSEVYTKITEGVTKEADEAVARFLMALSGEEKGKDLHEKFFRAKNWAEAEKEVVDEACVGLLNLRFGPSDINTAITNEFDPIVVDGRLDRRSMAIRDSVIGLGKAKLIKWATQFDALAITKDRHTGQDVTTTVLKRSSLNSYTGTRTVINPFAQPFEMKWQSREEPTLRQSDLHPRPVAAFAREV
jgi:hypothetical protein